MQIIWTNHLKERIQQRGLSPSLVDKAVRFPDQIIKSSTTDSNKHIKVIDGYKIVAAVKRQGSDWVITSAWWDFVNPHQKYTTKPKPFFLETLVQKFLLWLEKKLKIRP